MWFTIGLNLVVVLFVYMTALPLGTLAAVRANTWIDYLTSLIGYLGLATPNFLLALVLMYYGNKAVGLPIGGGMAKEFLDQPMSLEKLGSIMLHMIAPVIVIGTAGMAGMTRRLRANLLDELGKPYVTTAEAKGVSASRTVVKYPLRMALKPVHRGYRQPVAAACVGLGPCVGGDEPTHHWPDPAKRAQIAGHFPQRLYPAVCVRPDAGRHVNL